MSYELYQFGSTVLPYRASEDDIGSGQANLVVFGFPDGGAFDALGNDEAPVGETRLTKSCMLYSTGALRVDYHALKALVGTRAQLWRRHNDATMEWCWARFQSIRSTRKAKNRDNLDLDLTFLKLSPLWYSQTEQDITHYDVGSDDDDLTTTGAEGDTAATLAAIVNNGNAKQRAVTFTITANGADITALTVANATSGHTWSYAGTIADTKSLVVDCGALSVENDGTDDYAHFTPPTTKSEWMIFVPGNNILTVTVTGGPAIVKIEFYDAWK